MLLVIYNVTELDGRSTQQAIAVISPPRFVDPI